MKMKRILAIIMAVAMLVSMTAVSFAEANNHTLTIKSKTLGHTYHAYKVFAGDYEEVGDQRLLKNITWGAGVNGDALLTALKASTDPELAGAFDACTSAMDVADVLEGKGNDSAFLDAFAKVVNDNLTEEIAGDSELVVDGSDNPIMNGEYYQFKITGLDDGYYFVKEDQPDPIEGNSYTKFMLRLLDDEEVAAKTDAPDIDKKIVGEDEEGNTEYVESNNAAIGDTVNYKVTSHVPDISNYKTYQYIVKDTMSEGLTFDEDSVHITIGGAEFTDYVLNVPGASGETFTITFNDCMTHFAGHAAEEIIITYSATINENAALGIDPNTNTVVLEYTNNPNDNGTGETPESKVYSFVTGIDLHKIYKDAEGTHSLAGAKFKIEGEGLNIIVVVDENGQSTVTVDGATHVSDVFAVNADGHLIITGLKAGNYTITEVEAPNGYNKLANPMQLVITWAEGATPDTCTWTATLDGADITFNATTGVFDFEVENKKGTELPSTGGIGTTIFYVVGSALVLIAAVALIAKKRMGEE